MAIGGSVTVGVGDGVAVGLVVGLGLAPSFGDGKIVMVGTGVGLGSAARAVGLAKRLSRSAIMTTAETKVAKWGFTTLGVSALGWYMIASLTFLVVAANY
jgi:hypothetical protein